MKTTFYFADGTSWEWEDDPQDSEGLDIKNKYFKNSDLNGDVKFHLDIIKVIQSPD